jgi:hypothetical protein
MGVDWSLREGYAWAEDKEHCEEYGRMLQADPSKVSARAKKRGLPQVSVFHLFVKKYTLNTCFFRPDSVSTHCLGDRSLGVLACRFWNSLPENMRCLKDKETALFKKHLKTHLLKKYFE